MVRLDLELRYPLLALWTRITGAPKYKKYPWMRLDEALWRAVMNRDVIGYRQALNDACELYNAQST